MWVMTFNQLEGKNYVAYQFLQADGAKPPSGLL